uniref:Thaumatin-like protein n=1 Tax=Panagrolaimus superbus TaxID=310955 RepID=A0A914YTR7_9BILA
MNKIIMVLLFIVGASYARNIKIQNNCGFKIWPGWQGQSGTPNGGGTTLAPGQSYNLGVPDNWTGGRIWARTGCDGNFNCETGGCGNSEKCNGKWGETGVTLAEFGLNKWQNLDFYDVSLVDGFNLLTIIKPEGGEGDCKEIGKCHGNILSECPNDLKVIKNGKTVECQSACTKFRKEEFCCTGSHGSAATCGPTNYSKFFKDRCPQDYSYAFDDPTSTFTCKGSNYVVTFC